ncbi:Mur ligase [Leucogyrophana mollusca]|uniref:Mur ligase n=1 Tax=Leucogyrophana mollusca TaxID=85980 RepID=A0ACB8B6U1_9AGAM|nr:Mur ligase [Leucogyrophana mollusca]
MSIDLSLDRIRVLAQRLPAYTRPTCHIAGTNGKGSVSCLLSSILRASGLTVGRFNSPHLISIYDCIIINDEPVSPSAYKDARQKVEDANQGVGSSSFELLTLTALSLFEAAKLDVVVIEVGMGGRLDATNVIPDDCIIVSALTTVDLDHQQFLGNTVELIAQEKAGIARNGKPFVMGIQKHDGVEAVVKSVVASAGGRFVRAHAAEERAWDSSLDGPQPHFSLSAGPFTPPSQPIKYAFPYFSQDIHALLPLYGKHQLDNLGLTLSIVSAILTQSPSKNALPAYLASRITPECICKGIKSASWPGRLSFHRLASDSCSRPLTILADGAHNPASSQTLAAYISELISLPQDGQDMPHPRTTNLTFILALSHSPPKTPLETLSPLLPLRNLTGAEIKLRIAVLRFTPPDGMPWVTSVPPSELRQTVTDLAPEAEVWCASDAEDPREGQLGRALEWASGRKGMVDREELVVLAGSLYLVADFYRFINGIGAKVGLS